MLARVTEVVQVLLERLRGVVVQADVDQCCLAKGDAEGVSD